MVGSFVAQAVSAVTGLLIARLAGLDAYGQYATAFALAGAFAQTFLFGLDSVLPREVAKNPSATVSILFSSLFPVIAWSVLIMGAIVFAGTQLGYSGNVFYLLIVAAPIFALRALINLGRSALRGLEKMEKDASIQVVEAVLGLLFVGIAFALSSSIVFVIMAMFFAELIALGYTAFIVKRTIATEPFRFSSRISTQLVRSAAPLGATFMLIGFNLRLDTIILSTFHTDAEIGLYSAAFGIVILSSAISLVSAALLPRLSSLASSNQDEFGLLWGTGLRYTLIISLCTGLSISALAPWLIQFLYGPEFLAAVPILRVLGVVASLIFINRYLWHVLIALDKQKEIFGSAVVASIATLFFGIVFIRTWGVTGAAMAAIARELCQLAVLGFFANKFTPTIRLKESILSPLFAAITMLFVLLLVQNQHEIFTLFALPVAILCYFGALIATKGIQRQELATWTKRLAVLLVVGGIGLFSQPISVEAAQSCPNTYRIFESGNDGRIESILINTNFSSAGQDQITVFFDREAPYHEGNDQECWSDYVDFIDETWLYDAGADGTANLIIRFGTVGNAVSAELYDDQDGDNVVAYEVQNGRLVIQELLPKTERPATWSVRMVAPAGWWVRQNEENNRRANYNLNVYVNGNIEAVFGTHQFSDLLKNDNEVDFEIQVRDIDDDGHPDYDLRFLPQLSRLRGLGGFNTHLMMNLADNEEAIQPENFWPYIGEAQELSTNVIQQPNERRHPPILVDWQRSKIAAIHEMVASRAGENNCFFYSSMRPVPEAPSDLNFEAPFCFYDLAGDQDTVPELIIRNQYWVPNDPIFQLGQFPRPMAQVRYSWDHDNDGTLDYGIGLTGRKTIESIVPVLDYELKTVPYAEFPMWVTQERWDTAVFVAAERGYFSNEGIYEVDLPLDLVSEYLTGRTSIMPGAQIEDFMQDLISPSTIDLRLERNLHFDQQPQLYLSPIDGQLHLLGADDGIWQLQDGGTIFYRNLDTDAYLDQWEYIDGQGNRQSLIQAASWLIQDDGAQIVLAKNPLEKSLLTFSPPRNPDEYHELRERLGASGQTNIQHTQDDVQPADFISNAELFEHDAIRLAGARMRDFRMLDSGFRFILDATTLDTADQPMLAGHELMQEEYVVSVIDGQLEVRPYRPADLTFAPDNAHRTEEWTALQPKTITFIGANRGMEDLPTLTATLYAKDASGNELLVAQDQQPLYAEDSTNYRFTWTPPTAGKWVLSLSAEYGDELYTSDEVLPIQVVAPIGPSAQWFFKHLGAARWGLLLLIVSIISIAFGIVLLILPSLRIQGSSAKSEL